MQPLTLKTTQNFNVMTSDTNDSQINYHSMKTNCDLFKMTDDSVTQNT